MPEIPELPRMSNLEGAILSEYFLQQRISTGGVADVYRAIQQSEEQHHVAVKIYRSSHAQRASFRDYFMNEAEKIGQFEHPNILPILEFGEGEDLLYLVMPYIATGTLDDLLKRVGGRFSASQALPVMQHLSAALQYAHQHHVIHGNLKLSNVFVAADGRILLADFGIARGYGGYGESDESQQSLTRVGWGAAEYVAPEVSLGVLKRSSDVYSLGALLFRMLAGQPPFSGHTPVEVLLKHVRQTPPYARAFVPTISDAVDAVLQKALQKRPEDRFASVEEFNNAFSAAVASAPVAPIATPFAPSLLKSPTSLSFSDSFAVTPASIDPATPLPVGIFGQEAQYDPFLPLPSLPALTPPSIPSFAQAQEMISQQPQQLPRRQNQPRVTRQLSPAMPFDVEMPANGPDVGAEQVKTAQRADGPRQSGFEPGVVIGKQHFWSAEPVEWSPIGSSPGNAPLAHNIPSNAAEYLAGTLGTSGIPGVSGTSGTLSARRATAVLSPQSSPEAVRVAIPEADGDEPDAAFVDDESAFARRLRKWLPVIVVILLLLGLLGAFLSSFFFPMS